MEKNESQCLNPKTKWARFQSGVRPILGYACVLYIGYGLVCEDVSIDKFKSTIYLASALALYRGGEKVFDMWTSRKDS